MAEDPRRPHHDRPRHDGPHHDPDEWHAPRTRRGTHVELEGGSVPRPDDPSPLGSALGARLLPVASVLRHRHLSSARSPASRRFAIPAVVILVLFGVSLVASLLSPSHTGPLPTGVTLPLVLATIPLVFAAARRLGLRTPGSLVATVLAALILPTASSDVVGVVEHLAVTLGLVTVVLWPPGIRGIGRRYTSGALAGAAMAASPLAILAVAAVMGWLLRFPQDRAQRAKALIGPSVTGIAVATVGLVLLGATGAIDSTTWAGSVSFATIVVAMAPAFGIAGGLGADRSIAAVRTGERTPIIAGAIGLVGLCLIVALTIGATVSQIRDRSIAAEQPASAASASRHR